MRYRRVQAAVRQLWPAVLRTAPATRPVDSNIGRTDAKVAGDGHPQQNRAEQDAVAVSGEPVPPRAGQLVFVKERQVRRAEALNPAEMHPARHLQNPATDRWYLRAGRS
jgi:hypothetical protein